MDLRPCGFPAEQKTAYVNSHRCFGLNSTICRPFASLVGRRRQRPYRVYGVGFRRRLVRAVAQHAREAQGDAARVARAALHAVEGDLDDLLRADVDGPVVAALLEFQEPRGLPGQQLVGEALEGL